MKFTIVRSNRLNTFQPNLCYKAKVIHMFDEVPLFRSVLLETMLLKHTRIPNCYFNPQLKNIDSDIIIVFDGHSRPEFLEWLADNNSGKRLIFWCWNTIEEISQNVKLSQIPKRYEIWSYSEYDCKKYNLKYNTTFYWKEYEKPEYVFADNDIYFIGKDKGRYRQLKNLEKELMSNGINCNFQIVPTHPWNIKLGTVRKIPYLQVIDNINKSKAILDIMVTKSAGPTLRGIEAAFFKKKIISDDINITKMKFYKPQNSYIIKNGKINIREIKTLLNTPFKEIEEENLNYYKISNWLLRFLN